MDSISAITPRNRLLAALTEKDYALLRPHLVLGALQRSQVLIEPDEEIQHCWFIESGIVSIIAGKVRGDQTEVGLVGQEGMVDVAALHGVNRSSLRCVVQAPGDAYRIAAPVLQDALGRSESLRATLLRYSHSLLIQVASTTLANASCSVEERLARWLLMYHDRSSVDDLLMTHEVLSLMLNVRRAGITLAIKALATANVIRTRRGVVVITNRAALETMAGDGYGEAEKLTGWRD